MKELSWWPLKACKFVCHEKSIVIPIKWLVLELGVLNVTACKTRFNEMWGKLNGRLGVGVTVNHTHCVLLKKVISGFRPSKTLGRTWV